MSFLIYNAFFIVLCIIIMFHGVINFASTNGNENIYVLFFRIENTSKSSSIAAEIYVLMYSIMLLSIWANLYAFHRYYSTYSSTIHLQPASPAIICKRYVIYAILFTLLFAIQIHLFYWLFPAIICVDFTFNIYCNYQFKQILIRQFNLCAASESTTRISVNVGDNGDTTFLDKANFLWRTSVICCILQSLSLGLFIGGYKYNQNILYFLPLFWCLSSGTYSASFARNKRFFARKFSCSARIKQENQTVPKNARKPTLETVPTTTVTDSVQNDGDHSPNISISSNKSNNLSNNSSNPTVVIYESVNANETMTFVPTTKIPSSRGGNDKDIHIYTSC